MMNRTRWTNFHGRIHDHQYLRRIIVGWYDKSTREHEVHNKFLCLWIAFNAWVTNYMEEENVKQFSAKLEFLSDEKKDKTLSEEYKKLLRSEHFRSQVIRLKDKCPVKDARAKFTAKPKPFTDIDDFAQLIKAIYQVRNNPVHGGKSLDPGRDEELVTLAYNIFDPLFKTILDRLQ